MNSQEFGSYAKISQDLRETRAALERYKCCERVEGEGMQACLEGLPRSSNPHSDQGKRDCWYLGYDYQNNICILERIADAARSLMTKLKSNSPALFESLGGYELENLFEESEKVGDEEVVEKN